MCESGGLLIIGNNHEKGIHMIPHNALLPRCSQYVVLDLDIAFNIQDNTEPHCSSATVDSSSVKSSLPEQMY